MLTAYKYPFNIADVFVLNLPRGARPLHVEVQHGQPCMWALVDPTAPTEERTFRIAGTGHHIDAPPDKLSHVSTFLMAGGSLVWHVFEAQP